MAGRDGGAALPLSSRLVIAMAGLGFAGLALGSGLDRAVATRPDLAPYVPEAFRHQALVAQGAAAVKAGQSQAALHYGTLAVARAPMEGASAAVLGMGRLRTGDAAGAEQAFIVAGSRGWRVPLTQTYWMMRALEMRDYRVAASRLDAILRQQPHVTSDARVMAPFEQNPEAMDAMIDRMALRPNWGATYLGDLTNLDHTQLTGREMVLARRVERGFRPGCEDVRPLATELVRQGDVARARRVWGAYCPLAGPLLADVNLVAPVRDEAALAPFSWKLLGSGDLSLAERPAGQGTGQWLDVTNSGPLSAPVMRQMAVVPAGRYRVSWLARDAKGASSSGIAVQEGCEISTLERVGAPRDLGRGRWQADVVIDSACIGHWFQFVARPGQGTLTLGHVTLEPATGQ